MGFPRRTVSTSVSTWVDYLFSDTKEGKCHSRMLRISRVYIFERKKTRIPLLAEDKIQEGVEDLIFVY